MESATLRAGRCVAGGAVLPTVRVGNAQRSNVTARTGAARQAAVLGAKRDANEMLREK